MYIRPVAALGALLFAFHPATAQDLETIVTERRATEDCRTDEAEPVVCGRAQRSPYRLPEQSQGFDPEAGIDSVSRERHRLLEVGAVGIHSCSAVGPGGWTGCDLIRWKEKQEQFADGRRKEPRLSVGIGPLRKSVID